MGSDSESPVIRVGKFVAWVAGIAGAVFGYLQWQVAVQDGKRRDQAAQEVSGAQQVETAGTSSGSSGTGAAGSGGIPIREQPPVQAPSPIHYFAGTTANYLSVQADDAALAGNIRGLFQHGTAVTELGPGFIEDGRFRKAINNDDRWRTNVEVPASAQMLYLIDVGPLQRDKDAAVQRAIAARGTLRIVVLDLAKRAMVKSEQITLNGSAFTEEMLQQELGQQLASKLREHVREIMKNDQS